jgi:hypothetical protein
VRASLEHRLALLPCGLNCGLNWPPLAVIIRRIVVEPAALMPLAGPCGPSTARGADSGRAGAGTSCQGRHLLPPQPGDAAAGARGKPDITGPQRLTAAAQEVRQCCTIHTFQYPRRARVGITANQGSLIPR